MDTDQIRAFATIAREGSFGRAALTLDLAQATLSTRIQALERAVGGPLFLRGGRRIALTERGESFLCYAQRALALLDEGVEASRLAQEGQRGRVTLAVEQTLAEGPLARAIARLHRRHPRVEVAVEAAGCFAVVGKVHDGAARLGLVSWPYPSHAYDALTPLVRLRDPLILAVGPAHPLTARGRVTLAEVAALAAPFLALCWDHPTNIVQERIVAQAASALEVPAVTARQLVTQGTGAAFFPRTLIADDLAAGRLVAIPLADGAPLYREGALVRHPRGGALPMAVQNFVGIMRGEVAAAFIAPEEETE